MITWVIMYLINGLCSADLANTTAHQNLRMVLIKHRNGVKGLSPKVFYQICLFGMAPLLKTHMLKRNASYVKHHKIGAIVMHKSIILTIEPFHDYPINTLLNEWWNSTPTIYKPGLLVMFSSRTMKYVSFGVWICMAACMYVKFVHMYICTHILTYTTAVCKWICVGGSWGMIIIYIHRILGRDRITMWNGH